MSYLLLPIGHSRNRATPTVNSKTCGQGLRNTNSTVGSVQNTSPVSHRPLLDFLSEQLWTSNCTNLTVLEMKGAPAHIHVELSP